MITITMPRRMPFGRAGAPDRQEIIYCESCYNAEVV